MFSKFDIFGSQNVFNDKIYFFNSHRCCCGQSRTTHQTIPGIEAGTPGDVWIPYKHTRAHPTDAYGTIEFQGGAHPTKAQVCIIPKMYLV